MYFYTPIVLLVHRLLIGIFVPVEFEFHLLGDCGEVFTEVNRQWDQNRNDHFHDPHEPGRVFPNEQQSLRVETEAQADFELDSGNFSAVAVQLHGNTSHLADFLPETGGVEIFLDELDCLVFPGIVSGDGFVHSFVNHRLFRRVFHGISSLTRDLNGYN